MPRHIYICHKLRLCGNSQLYWVASRVRAIAQRAVDEGEVKGE
jgi:hypothetical protein